MIKILSVDGVNIDIECTENASHSGVKNISEFIRDDSIYISLTLMLENIIGSFYPWMNALPCQQLWQSYFNNSLSLIQVQAEATSRSIDTTGKTQDQLAKEIVQYECTAHGTTYLLGA